MRILTFHQIPFHREIHIVPAQISSVKETPFHNTEIVLVTGEKYLLEEKISAVLAAIRAAD